MATNETTAEDIPADVLEQVTAPPGGTLEPVAPEVIGTQFMTLISKDVAGNEVKAMQIGQRGVIVVSGLTSVFVPGADIVDRGVGKQIV